MRYIIAIIIVIIGILLTCCKSHQLIVDSSLMSDSSSSKAVSIYADSIKVTDSTRVVITDSVTYIYRIINNNRTVSSHDTITVVDSIFINNSSETKAIQKDNQTMLLWLFSCVSAGLLLLLVFFPIIKKNSK